MKYQLYNYKTGDQYTEHTDLNGAMLSGLFHVKNGDQLRWSGGPKVWFGHVNRQKLPALGIDAIAKGRGGAVVRQPFLRSSMAEVQKQLMQERDEARALNGDLLEALKVAEKRLAELHNSPTALSFARAAIAKAEGKQS